MLCAHDGQNPNHPFPLQEERKHLPLPAIYDAYETSHMLILLSTLAPLRVDAGRCTDASRLRAPAFRLWDSLSKGSRTVRCLAALPSRVVLMGQHV